MPTYPSQSGTLVRGVNEELNVPVIIPRQRRNTVVGPPFGALQPNNPSFPLYPKGDISSPGGYLRGEDDEYGSVLRWRKNYTNSTGAFVYTEGFGTNTINSNWNGNGRQNLTGANIGTLPLLCPIVQDVLIDGNWQNGQSEVCGGIFMEGSGHKLKDVGLRNIPGNAIVLTAGKAGTTRAGVPGVYAERITRLRDISINSCWGDGLTINVSDAKVFGFYAVGCTGVGLKAGNATHVVDSHCWGCDDAACRTIAGGSIHTGVYYEASPYGFDIQHDGTQCHGINVGPGTTWVTCIRARAQCAVHGIFGSVRASDAEHPGIVGIDMDPNGVHSEFTGSLVVNGPSTMMLFGGHRNTVRFKGFSATDGDTDNDGPDIGAVAVKWVTPGWTGPCTGNTAQWDLHAYAGVIADLRESGLFSGTSNGGGNHFKFNLELHGPDPIPYLLPAGKTLADLRPGNTLEFNITAKD